MQVRIAELKPGKNQYSFSADGSALGLDGSEAVLSGPVTAEITIEKREADLRFTGTVKADVRSECSRCLEPVDSAVGMPFTLAGTIVDEGGDASGDDGDLIVCGHLQTEIDLAGIIREQVLLALPGKPLCSEGCRGLCPQCGANLNRETCGCTGTQVDDRWAKLAELKNRKQ